MSSRKRFRQWRDWFPIPKDGVRPELVRWVLLEGNRLAVTGALLTFVYVTILAIGIFWPFEMQRLLTETSTIENILITFLSGIILLVSIVVSINSITLSQDITSVETQEAEVRGAMDFRRKLGDATESGESPSDPLTFLETMSAIISQHAHRLMEVTENSNAEFPEKINAYANSIVNSLEPVSDLDTTHGSDFAVLWIALELDYGDYLDEGRALRGVHEGNLPEACDEPLDRLLEAFQLFAIGRENFKTIYYIREVSRFSRTLLVVSLPAILITSTAILAINAQLLPEVWILGLPPLQSFVATVFTIALIPYVILTSYVLRLSTVALHSATSGPFSLE